LKSPANEVRHSRVTKMYINNLALAAVMIGLLELTALLVRGKEFLQMEITP
jgi:hypothetical protein